MIIHGRVTNFAKVPTNDGGELYKMFYSDASKPMELRSETTFVTFLSGEARKALPSGDQIDGKEITVLPRSMKGTDGGIQVKGQVVPGHVPVEQLHGGKLPTKPETAAK